MTSSAFKANHWYVPPCKATISERRSRKKNARHITPPQRLIGRAVEVERRVAADEQRDGNWRFSDRRGIEARHAAQKLAHMRMSDREVEVASTEEVADPVEDVGNGAAAYPTPGPETEAETVQRKVGDGLESDVQRCCLKPWVDTLGRAPSCPLD